MNVDYAIERLLCQQAALAHFGSFAFGETDLQKILSEAARICAESLGVPFSKICRYRAKEDDLLVVAGFGWEEGVVGHVISQADESSTQGRAFRTGQPVILEDIKKSNSYNLPDFYASHGIVSTVDVLIKGRNGPFGVLEADSAQECTFDENDITFLTGFANVVAEAVGTAERTATLRATLIQMEELIAEKEALLEEKSILAAELQHRVRNNLQLVYGMLIRQIELADENGKEGVRAIARRVMSLATIYNHLLGHGLVQTIDFGPYLKSLCANLQDFQEKGEFEITLTCTVETIELDLDLVTALGITTTEIISNAYLHAFPHRPGEIHITLVQKDDRGILMISDNGVGFKPDKESKRHGVGLIKRLMQQIKGTAQVQSEHGTIWTLDFPVSDLALNSLPYIDFEFPVNKSKVL
jgi:two-component sensor histidine kinase